MLLHIDFERADVLRVQICRTSLLTSVDVRYRQVVSLFGRLLVERVCHCTGANVRGVVLQSWKPKGVKD